MDLSRKRLHEWELIELSTKIQVKIYKHEYIKAARQPKGKSTALKLTAGAQGTLTSFILCPLTRFWDQAWTTAQSDLLSAASNRRCIWPADEKCHGLCHCLLTWNIPRRHLLTYFSSLLAHHWRSLVGLDHMDGKYFVSTPSTSSASFVRITFNI